MNQRNIPRARGELCKENRIVSIYVVTDNIFFRHGFDALIQSGQVTTEQDIILLDSAGKHILVLHHHQDKMPACLYRKFELFNRMLIGTHAPGAFYHNLISYQKIMISGYGLRLTERELQVLSLLVKGFTMHCVARILRLSFKTVSRHKINGLRRLRIKNISALSVIINKWSSCKDLKTMDTKIHTS